MNQIYRIKAPAKINIRLKVIKRRPDGYHDLVTIMVPIEIFDHLELELLANSQIRIASDGFMVPTNEENLVYKAAQKFFLFTGIKKGVSIKITKNIPVAAGLGGGSSDAAATLLLLNNIFSKPIGRSDLHSIAKKLGADIPFFLECKPSIATGIGEILEPISNWPESYYLLITPPIEISTQWVFQNLKLELTTGREYDYIVDALKSDTIEITQLIENDLESVTCSHFPLIDSIKRQLISLGAEGALMSGSGPSVFGIFKSESKALSAKKALVNNDLGNIVSAKNFHKDSDR